ncbi:hypothetical protein F4814DRAFT_376920 [Daldinia grandis]|nr:hypothetical protein F4814DRAFT_376920 [Daldinia grandis]
MMNAALERQIGVTAIKETVVGRKDNHGMIPEWAISWKCMVRILEQEIAIGAPIFFSTKYIAEVVGRWPIIKTTKSLQNMQGNVKFRMSDDHEVAIPAKFVLMAPKDRAHLTGVEVDDWQTASKSLVRKDNPQRYQDYIKAEINRYDPRLQQSRGCSWPNLGTDERLSWLKMETVRCCEMGVIPTEVMKRLESNYLYYLNRKFFFDTDEEAIIAPDRTLVPLRSLPVPTAATQVEQDLAFWRAHDTWPSKVGSRDRLTAINLFLAQITARLGESTKRNEELQEQLRTVTDTRRSLEATVAKHRADRKQHDKWKRLSSTR